MAINLLYLLIQLLLFSLFNLTASIHCTSITSSVSANTYGSNTVGLSCPTTYSLVSCGFKTNNNTQNLIKGSYINPNDGLCYARNGFGSGVYAIARCCDLSSYSISCESYQSQPNDNNIAHSKIYIQCPLSTQSLLGCTSRTKANRHHGNYPNTADPIWTPTVLSDPDTCAAWSFDDGVSWSFATCCSSNIDAIFQCQSIWSGATTNQYAMISCPNTDQFMSSCSGSSDEMDANQWEIDNNNQCIVRNAEPNTGKRIIAIAICCSISNPTSNPTIHPTPIPTPIPTSNPTSKPTAITTSPTLSTSSPTVSTRTPTNTPTFIPTISPTVPAPTSNPSKYPTNIPSKVPTKMPTINPTINPSKAPTEYPTISPLIATSSTNNPTNIPTKYPIKIPTIHPTLHTNNPTTASPVDTTISPVDTTITSSATTTSSIIDISSTYNPTTASPVDLDTFAPTTTAPATTTGTDTKSSTMTPIKPTVNPSKTPTENPTISPINNTNTASPVDPPTFTPTTTPSATTGTDTKTSTITPTKRTANANKTKHPSKAPTEYSTISPIASINDATTASPVDTDTSRPTTDVSVTTVTNDITSTMRGIRNIEQDTHSKDTNDTFLSGYLFYMIIGMSITVGLCCCIIGILCIISKYKQKQKKEKAISETMPTSSSMLPMLSISPDGSERVKSSIIIKEYLSNEGLTLNPLNGDNNHLLQIINDDDEDEDEVKFDFQDQAFKTNSEIAFGTNLLNMNVANDMMMNDIVNDMDSPDKTPMGSSPNEFDEFYQFYGAAQKEYIEETKGGPMNGRTFDQ